MLHVSHSVAISIVHVYRNTFALNQALNTVSKKISSLHSSLFFVSQMHRIRVATPSFTRSLTSLRRATLREHKATVTLAAVLGAFLICWLPYMIFFTCMGLRRETEPPKLAHSIVLWLGYFNSALNPILYPALNRDFRRAYGHLLHCRNPCKNLSISIINSGKGRSTISNEFQCAKTAESQ